MGPHGWTAFNTDHRFLPQRWLRRIRVIALALLFVGLSIAPSATQAATAKVHVYLMRGLLNVLSLGMDEIAAKLRQQGINATVHSHLAWRIVADEAAVDYKSGRVRTIILVGHSLGAGAVTDMVARLGELGVPVKLAIGLDPAFHATVSGRVGHYTNYYVSSGFGQTIERGPGLRGTLQNVDVTKPPFAGPLAGIVHLNIEKNQAMQARVIREIRAAI